MILPGFVASLAPNGTEGGGVEPFNLYDALSRMTQKATRRTNKAKAIGRYMTVALAEGGKQPFFVALTAQDWEMRHLA